MPLLASGAPASGDTPDTSRRGPEHMSASPTILPPKLCPDIRRTAQVTRGKLVDRFLNAEKAKLVLVSAPAGFGKTTTMIQLREALQDRGVSTAWLTLDAADNDLSRFRASLVAVSSQMGLEQAPGADVRCVVSQLCAQERPFALFLDDLEAVRSSGVMGSLQELLEVLPQNGLLVAGSRKLPTLDLARLRARDELLDIGAELLRFTYEETAQFFELRGGKLSIEAIDRAHEKAEGWAAALCLLSLTLQRVTASGDDVAHTSLYDRDIADYLTEEVLSQQSSEAREFLLRTSILRGLSAPLCQALVPNVDCAAMLGKLRRDNVFIGAVDHSPNLYRYHWLFGDFLRNLLHKELPDDVTRLHLAASGAYEAQGRYMPAIDHAIEGGDYPHALYLLEEHAAVLLEQGRFRLLNRWFSLIPAPLLRNKPLMQVVAAWARCLSQGPWTALEWIESSECTTNNDEQVQAHLRALRPVLLAMMDRYKEAHAAGQSALARRPSGNRFVDSILSNAMAHIVSIAGPAKEALLLLNDARKRQGVDSFNRMYSETISGMLDLRGGRLRQAAAKFRSAIASCAATPFSYTHGNAWAGVPYAEVLYEGNDLAGSARLLNAYLPLAREVGLPDHMISSYRTRARIAFIHGDVGTALQTITELEYLGHQRKLPRVTASAKLERSRILLLQGHTSAAREECMRASDPTIWDCGDLRFRPAHEVEDAFIGRTRLELHVGDTAALLRGLQAEIRIASLRDRHQRALKLKLLLALALLQCGKSDRAVDETIPVLQRCSEEGYLRLLLDEGPILSTLLRRVQESSTRMPKDPGFREHFGRLMGQLDAAQVEDEPPPRAMDRAIERLSPTELRVLQLLAEGHSNAALTKELLVSNSTVRTHLRNIYIKLDCHNRMQAVAIARKRGHLR